jgi:hypothetical protein
VLGFGLGAFRNELLLHHAFIRVHMLFGLGKSQGYSGKALVVLVGQLVPERTAFGAVVKVGHSL